MRAFALDYEHRQLVDAEMPPPVLEGPDQVVFRVREVGICGTDRELAAFRLGFPPEGESRLVLGHEALGQVVATGLGVAGLRRGDWVVPLVRRPCSPPCASCARGRRDLCVSGRSLERGIFGLHGYFAECAVDSEADLVRVPEALLDYAVLIEPLSVVEKAIHTAWHMHEPGPQTALVLGAGPIGLLAALAFQARGLRVALHSLEPPGHPRACLAQAAGIRYLTRLGTEKADLVLEATGSPEAALAGLGALAPLGVYGVLGATAPVGRISFTDLLVNNQKVFGSVNASPPSFAAAIEDLGRFDRSILARVIRRESVMRLRESIANPGNAVKVVHVMAE